MVEMIFISIKEVMYYEWLSTYKIEIKFEKNSTATDPLFGRTIASLIRSGLKAFPDKSDEIKTNYNEDILCISLKKADDIAVLNDVCEWIKTKDLSHPDPQKDVAVFYRENKEIIAELFGEIKQILTDKPSDKYRRFYQCVDGMN